MQASSPPTPTFLLIALLAVALIAAAGVQAAPPGPDDAPVHAEAAPDAAADDPPPGQAAQDDGEATSEQDVPDVTITGKKAPVEQGERSNFRTLPPRDVIERPLTESPGLDTATSVIGSEEIRWLDAFSVVDALKYVPGSWIETRGRKVKQFFSVRGQRYPYPGYLIDGAWFREFHESQYFLSAANIERIEVLRSSGSMLLSPGGLTGMVNIIPRTYTERQTTLDVEYGRFNTAITNLSHGGMVGDTSYAFGAGYYHTDGPSGDNAAENITNLYGRIVKPVEDWTFSLTTMSFFGDRQLEYGEYPAQEAFATRKEQYDPMHAYYVIGKAVYEPTERAATEIVTNYGLRRLHGQQGPAQSWLEKDYEYGLRIMQALMIGENNRLRFGGLFNHWVSPTGKRFYVGRRGDLWTYSGVIVDEHDFGRLLVNAGYRVTRTYWKDFGGFNVEGAAGRLATVQVEDEWEDPLHTITAGASYRLTDEWSLHGNFTWGQISATPGMLDVNLQRPGTETRTKYDLGIKREWEAFGEVTLTGFYVRQQDAALITNDRVTINGVDFGLYGNADRKNYGIELDVRSKRFKNGLQMFFNAVAMRTRQQFGGNWGQDEEVPGLIMSGGASYLISNWEFSLLAKYVSSYENERFLPRGAAPADLGDYTDVAAKVTYYFGDAKQHYVYVGVENLCNKHYSTVAGWPNEGAFVKGGLSLQF